MNVMGKVKRIVSLKDNFVVAELEATSEIPKECVYQYDPKRIYIKGALPPLTIGVTVGVKGSWKYSEKYGWSFYADSVWEEKPSGKDQILAYLCSDLFHGIGPSLSEAIWKKFGDDTLDVLENEPSRLQKVPGIGPKRAFEIGSAFKNSQAKRELFFYLTQFGVPSGKIAKIYAEYEKPLQTVKEDPYAVGVAVGLDFNVCDSIAYHQNLAYNCDSRIRHGILHALCDIAFKQGHSFLPITEVVQRTCDLLQKSQHYKDRTVDDLDIRYQIAALVSDGKLVEEDGVVYDRFVFECERNTAERLKRAMAESVKPIEDVDAKIAKIEATLGVDYGDEQKEAFRMLSQTNVVVITGGPGTGKTTVVKVLIEMLKMEYGDEYIVKLCSPTGRAAKRMTEATGYEAQTIHRLLDFVPFGNDLKHKDENDPIEANAIIVDEVSMLSIDLASTLLSAVAPGTRLIFLGDIDQLPAVGAGNVLGDMITGGVPTVHLKKVYRQAETSLIVKNAKLINIGEVNLVTGPDFKIVETDEPSEIIACIRDEMYAAKDLDDIQTLTPMRRRPPVGVNQLNPILQNALNPPVPLDSETDDELPELKYGSTVYRPGDKVMQFANNYKLNLFNGDTGVVVKIVATGEVTINVDGRPVVLQKSDLDDIGLAYASTVHKAQGSEYGKVIIPFHSEHKSMFTRSLLYTAVTRAKSSIVLVGEKDVIKAAIKNARKISRYSRLYLRLRSSI